MRVVTSFQEARHGYEGSVGCVPTMGFLHEGHLSLIAAARADDQTVVVTLFVNPLQFGPGEDLERYPRDFDRDAALAEGAGTDILFAPSTEDMYPTEPASRVTVRGLADTLEGAHRPGHFEGVATVVTKLLAGLRPDRAYFGRKDAQQLSVVRRLVADLSFPAKIIGCPTVREPDGLALSSRNINLEERSRALGLSAGLRAAEAAIRQGEQRGPVLERVAREEAERRGLELQYASLVDADTIEPLEQVDRESFLAVAARVGKTRLIDNLYITVNAAGRVEPDFGHLLPGPSVLYDER